MRFRVPTLNLEQDHKRWDARRELIQAEIGRLKPDIRENYRAGRRSGRRKGSFRQLQSRNAENEQSGPRGHSQAGADQTQ